MKLWTLRLLVEKVNVLPSVQFLVPELTIFFVNSTNTIVALNLAPWVTSKNKAQINHLHLTVTSCLGLPSNSGLVQPF